MNRAFVIAVVCALCNFPVGVAQNPPAVEPHQADLEAVILKFHDLRMQDKVNEITFTRDALQRLKEMPGKLAGLDAEKRKKFLGHVEEAYGIFPGPSQYKEEILPLLIGNLRGEPLPREGTRLQRDIIKQGGGRFDGMVREALHFINEKRDFLLAQQKKLREEIDGVEKTRKRPGS